MASYSAELSQAGVINPKKPATYPVVLGEDITGNPNDPSSKSTFVGIRYNFKPKRLFDKTTPRTGTLTAKDPANQNSEDSNFDVTLRDSSGGRYVYAGTRASQGSKFVLVFDSKLRRFILHRLDSLYALNLTDSPNNHDAEALKKKYPQIDRFTKRIRPPRGVVARRRPVVKKITASPMRPMHKPLMRPTPRPPSVLRSSQDIKRKEKQRALLAVPGHGSHGSHGSHISAGHEREKTTERDVVSPTKLARPGVATSPTALKTKSLGNGSPYISPATPLRGKLGLPFSSKPREGSKLYKETRPSPETKPHDDDDARDLPKPTYKGTSAEDLPKLTDKAKSIGKSMDDSRDKVKAKAKQKPLAEGKGKDVTSSPSNIYKSRDATSLSNNTNKGSGKVSKEKRREESRGDTIEVKVRLPEKHKEYKGKDRDRDSITVKNSLVARPSKEKDTGKGKDTGKSKDAVKGKDFMRRKDIASSSSSGGGGSSSSSKGEDVVRNKDLGKGAASSSAGITPTPKVKTAPKSSSSSKSKAAPAPALDLPMPKPAPKPTSKAATKPMSKPAAPPPEMKTKKRRDWEEEDDDEDDCNYEDIGLVIEFPGGPSSASTTNRNHGSSASGHGGSGSGKEQPATVPRVRMRTFDDFQRTNALGVDGMEEVGSDEDMEGFWDPREEAVAASSVAAAAGSSSSSTAVDQSKASSATVASVAAPAPAAQEDEDEDMDELEEELLKELQEETRKEEEARKKLEAELEAEMEAEFMAAASESEVSEEE